MKKVLSLSIAVVLLFVTARVCWAAVAPDVRISVDVLSDSGKSGLDPYIRSLVSSLTKRWTQAAAGLPPERGIDHHETLLDLTLAKDGQVLSLRQQGTESDELWSHAAWEAAKGNAYPPLPTTVKTDGLKLRLHFVRLQ